MIPNYSYHPAAKAGCQTSDSTTAWITNIVAYNVDQELDGREEPADVARLSEAASPKGGILRGSERRRKLGSPRAGR